MQYKLGIPGVKVRCTSYDLQSIPIFFLNSKPMKLEQLKKPLFINLSLAKNNPQKKIEEVRIKDEAKQNENCAHAYLFRKGFGAYNNNNNKKRRLYLLAYVFARIRSEE